MKSSPEEQHVFKDVENYFTKKIRSFHEAFVEHPLLTGVDSPNLALDKVKMTKNPKFTLLYYKRIVGGIMAGFPLITIKSFSKKTLRSYCAIHYLNNEEDIENFFYIQNVMNWGGTKKTCFQVWKLKSNSNLLEMNRHWL